MEALFNRMLEEENTLKKTLQDNVSTFGMKIDEYRKQLRVEDSKALEELVFSNDEIETFNNRASPGLVREVGGCWVKLYTFQWINIFTQNIIPKHFCKKLN